MDPFIPIQTTSKSFFSMALDILLLFVKIPLFTILILEIVIINDFIFRKI